MITRDRFPELLQNPGRSWMRGHVAMQDSTGSHVHDDEYVEHPKPRRHRNQEVAGHDGRVVANERLPVL